MPIVPFSFPGGHYLVINPWSAVGGNFNLKATKIIDGEGPIHRIIYNWLSEIAPHQRAQFPRVKITPIVFDFLNTANNQQTEGQAIVIGPLDLLSTEYPHIRDTATGLQFDGNPLPSVFLQMEVVEDDPRAPRATVVFVGGRLP